MSSFFENPAHRLVGDLPHDLKLYQLVGQQSQAPAGLALWWLATGKRDQPRLLLPVQLPVVLSSRRVGQEHALLLKGLRDLARQAYLLGAFAVA